MCISSPPFILGHQPSPYKRPDILENPFSINPPSTFFHTHEYKARFKTCLPFNSVDYLNMFVFFVNTLELPLDLKSELVKLGVPEESLNSRQFRYLVTKAHNYKNINKNSVNQIVKYWLGLLG